jgi:hypothetical protein
VTWHERIATRKGVLEFWKKSESKVIMFFWNFRQILVIGKGHWNKDGLPVFVSIIAKYTESTLRDI